MFKRQVDSLSKSLALVETEENWDTIAKSISMLTTLFDDGTCDVPAEGQSVMRSFSRPLVNAMNSERTRLSGAAINLIGAVASALGTDFEPLVPLYLPPLLALTGRTNKVVIGRARTCILAIIENTQLPSILPHLLQNVHDKVSTLRLMVAEATLACVKGFNPPDLEKETRAREIEAIIRATATDASAEVRKIGRQIFEAYKLVLPARVESFTAPLTPTIRKYLDIKSRIPNSRSQSPTRPSSRPPSRTTESNKPKPQLSSSTSTHRAPTGLHPQRSQTHQRSVSSSTVPVSSHRDTSLSRSETTKPKREYKPERAMPPPEFIPIRPQPGVTKQLLPSRSTSAINERVRAVSTSTAAVRPTISTATTTGAIRVASQPEAGRMHQSSAAAPQQLVDTAEKRYTSGGARRIMLPDPVPSTKDEVTKPSTSIKGAIAPSKSSSSVARSEPANRNDKSGGLKKVTSRAQLTKVNDKAKSASAETKPAADSSKTSREKDRLTNVKGKGVTQPTLAQLARTKPPIERKATAPASNKPSWGSRKAAPTGNKPGAKNSAEAQKTRALPKPGSRAVTPTLVPLPPSPTPSDKKQGGEDGKQSPDHDQMEDVSPKENSDTPNELHEGSKQDQGGDGEEAADPTQSEHESQDDNTHSRPTSTDIPEDLQIILTASSPQPDNTEANILSTPKSTVEINIAEQEKTPISALFSSIQQGFLFTPASPLSPPAHYVMKASSKNLKAPLPLHVHAEASLEDDEIAFGLGMLQTNPIAVVKDDLRQALSNVEINQ